MFSPVSLAFFVCWVVSTITQKLLNRFQICEFLLTFFNISKDGIFLHSVTDGS